MLGQIPPQTPNRRVRDSFNVPLNWTLELPTTSFRQVTYRFLELIWAELITFVFSIFTWKSYLCCWPLRAVWNIHRQQHERSCTCPSFFSLFFLFLFCWQLKHAGFHSFSGTFASVLPTALNNGALCACVRWREARAQVCPLFIIERLVGLPADPSLLCYLRADKGGRCEEEINVNPSVFN